LKKTNAGEKPTKKVEKEDHKGHKKVLGEKGQQENMPMKKV